MRVENWSEANLLIKFIHETLNNEFFTTKTLKLLTLISS